MPQTGNTRFNLAAYMKARKEARDKQVFKNGNSAKELKRIERLEKKVLKVLAAYVLKLNILLFSYYYCHIV